MGDFIPPMLLERRDTPFDDPRFLFEPKIDGRRMLLHFENGKPRMFTRYGNEVSRQFPELQNVPADTDVILDGEVAYINPETGAFEFETVLERFRMRKKGQILDGRRFQPVHYFVFDILRAGEEDVRNRPLTERKAILNGILGENACYSRLFHIENEGKALFEQIKSRRLEGIVAKTKISPYVGGRSGHWQGIMNYEMMDVFIAGYRKNQFGWLARTAAGHNVGVIELPVGAAHKKAFSGLAKSIVVGEDRNFVYLRPQIKARVRFRRWTREGRLHRPEFIDFVG